MTARWMAHENSNLREICGNPDISKASTGISSEVKLALGWQSDYYLTGHGQQWIRNAFFGVKIIRGAQLREKSY